MNPTAVAPASTRPAARRRPAGTALAGAAYVGSWVAGLLTAPHSPDHNAAAATVHAFYRTHAVQVAGSALLVHGTAGVALAAIAVGVARRTRATGGMRRAVLGTGLAAAALSLLQFAIACVAAAGTTATTSRTLFQSIDFLDALKLALLAAFATVATSAARRIGAAPRWLRITAAALAPLLIGGSAALVGITAAMPVLELSLLALLVWAAGICLILSRRHAD
jgi:hypothetical protein